MPSTLPPRRPILTLKPRVKELGVPAAQRIKVLVTRTLKEKQQSNGRTLALDSKAWRDLRAHVLSCEPLCRHCTAEGKTSAATDVDHRDNDPTNNDLVNLQPLCHQHHSLKTAAEMRGLDYMLRGCTPEGLPVDSDHHWNKSPKSPATDGSKPTGTPCSNP